MPIMDTPYGTFVGAEAEAYAKTLDSTGDHKLALQAAYKAEPYSQRVRTEPPIPVREPEPPAGLLKGLWRFFFGVNA